MKTGHVRPLIYAHRGASAYAPENTLAAFKLALDQGADGIELDAKLSADGEIVVIHDQTVERTTGTKGLVRNLTIAQLHIMDAGSWKSPIFKGEKIPTLAEVFIAVGGKMIINIELTNYQSPFDGLPEKAVDLVRKFKIEDSVIFSSFLQSNLSAVRKLWPAAPLGILSLPGLSGSINRSGFSRWVSPEYSHPHFKDVTPQLVKRETAAGRKLNVWTVNDSAEMDRLIGLGVEGIITDDPLLAITVRGEG